MEVVQQTDTAEQITDKMFKPEITRLMSSHLNTRRRPKINFDPIGNVVITICYNINRTEN